MRPEPPPVRAEDPSPPPPPPAPQPRSSEDLDPAVASVIEHARALLGHHTVHVKGRTFRYDCSGFVRGVTSVLGVDVMSEPGEDDDNGVRLIHRWVERHGENHRRKVPRPGDIVYFDNTWDKNGNGKLDDPLTHVGLVEAVGEDGTVQVIHRATRGIVRDPMNLIRPHETHDEQKRPINSILRSKGKRDPAATPHLMSELWAGFGTIRVQANAGAGLPELLLLLACDCH